MIAEPHRPLYPSTTARAPLSIFGTGRLVFRDVKVPKQNLIGELHGGALVFHQMMIPERLTSAAASLGVRAALEIAVRCPNHRLNDLVAGDRFLIMTPFFEPGAPPASLIEQITC